MKVLFVGEGNHELGPATTARPPSPTTGVLFTLARKVCPLITEGLAIRWREIASLPLNRKKLDRDLKRAGYETKVKRAILLSGLVFACAGTVCVVDGDTAAEDCMGGMLAGRDAALAELGKPHAVALGIAVLSIDAWILGARHAIAQELGIDIGELAKEYPRGKHIEELSGTSGNLGHQPKRVLEAIVQLVHRSDSAELREAIAERTEIQEIERECPKGFQPFAESLRAAFGAAP